MTLDGCFNLHKIHHTETGYGLYRCLPPLLFTLMLFTLLDFGETAVSSEFADAEEVHFKVFELKKSEAPRLSEMVQLPTLILGRKGTGMLVFFRVPIFVCVRMFRMHAVFPSLTPAFYCAL